MAEGSELRIDVLGRFRVRAGAGDAAVTVSSRGREILAALLLADGPVPRQRLAVDLWPESTDGQARTNLRRELHDLRHTLPLGGELLTSSPDGSDLSCSDAVASDAREFRRALARAETSGADASAEAEALSAAVAAYAGDLMPDVFSDWLAPERERLRQRAGGALRRLSRLLEARGEPEAAIRTTRRLMELEPYDETAVRSLMRLQTSAGDRAAAIHTYHRCASVLKRELDVDPDGATRDLYRALLARPGEAAPSALVAPATPDAPDVPPFEGRAAATAELRQAQAACLASGASVALVLGVAGIGKSRLVEELAHGFEREGAVVARARAYAAEGQLSYAPVVEWLRSPAMRASLGALDAPSRWDLGGLLPELRRGGSAAPGTPSPASGDDAYQQHRMFEAVARVLLAPGAPVVLVLDDLQWCDSASLAVMHFLDRARNGAPHMLLTTARTDELEDNAAARMLMQRWRENRSTTVVELGPLTRAEIARLARRIVPAGGTGEDGPEIDRLFALSEGNPLFAIEALRVAGHGADTGDELEVRHGAEGGGPDAADDGAGATGWLLRRSPRVRAVLHTRFSQLGRSALALAQCAAIIGRGFGYGVLLEACDLPEETLVQALDELWRRRIVRELGDDGYDFSHDALREAAAATLSAAQARLLHRRVAEALERVHEASLDGVSASVASHCERAGMRERAIEAYLRAARNGSAVHAHAEAARLLERALALVRTRPEHAGRDRRELDLLLLQAPVLRAASGYTAPRLAEAMERARDLSTRLGDPAARFLALRHLWTVRFVGGSLDASQRIARELQALAATLPHLAGESHHAMGGTLTNLGSFDEAIEHFEAARRHYDRREARSRVARFGSDLGTFAFAWEAHALWLRGYEDRALQASVEAVRIARDLEHTYSRALAHAYAAVLHFMRRDRRACAASADATVELCERYGFAYYHHWGTLLRGWARAPDDPEDAVRAMRAALASLDAEGAFVRRPIYLSAVAEVEAMQGDAPAAAATLTEAAALAARSGEHLWDAELLRLRSELAPDPDEGERLARCAVARARAQQAPPLALRSAVTLGRLVARRPQPIDAAGTRAVVEAAMAAMPQGSASRERAEALRVLSALR